MRRSTSPASEKEFFSNFSCCGLTLADMHQLLDHYDSAHSSPQHYSFPFPFPDLEEPYNPFGFDDYPSTHPHPLLRINTTFPPPSPSSAASSPPPLTSTAYSSTTSPSSLAPSPSPSPFNDTNLPSIHNANDHIHHLLQHHFPQPTNVNTCLPPALLTLPTHSYSQPQGIPQRHSFASHDPPYIARRGSSGPGLPLPLPLYPSTQLITEHDPEAYIIPPSISRRHSSFGLHSSSLSSSVNATSNTNKHSVSPRHTNPTISGTSPQVQGSIGPHRHQHTHTRILPDALNSTHHQRAVLSPPSQSAHASSNAHTTNGRANAHTTSNLNGRAPSTTNTSGVGKGVGVGVGTHRAVLITTTGHRAQTGRPPVLGGRRRKDGRVKAFKCPHPGCTKTYLNPNGLKYHLEKGTCSIDPAFLPSSTSSSNSSPSPITSSSPITTTSHPSPDANSTSFFVTMDFSAQSERMDREECGGQGEGLEREDEGQGCESELEGEEGARWTGPIVLPRVPPVLAIGSE